MRRVVGFTGRSLVTAGILILLLVAYQLWGTGIYEARAQARLKDQFHAAQRTHPSTTTTTAPPDTAPTPSSETTTTAGPPPPEGDAVAIIRIPKIGVERAVVQGVSLPDLRKGPGHYPNTPLPGQLGNAAIAGHRTTYGAPFNRLDEVDTGDEIDVSTLFGNYRYTITERQVVKPSQIEVLDPPKDPTVAELTLTTCNPKYSASQRLIVHAVLDKPTSAPPQPAPPPHVNSKGKIDVTDNGQAGLSGTKQSHWPAYAWGVIVAILGALWWLAFHRYPRWTTWFAGAIPFAVVLFVFFTYFERLLPSNV